MTKDLQGEKTFEEALDCLATEGTAADEAMVSFTQAKKRWRRKPGSVASSVGLWTGGSHLDNHSHADDLPEDEVNTGMAEIEHAAADELGAAVTLVADLVGDMESDHHRGAQCAVDLHLPRLASTCLA